MKNGKLVNILSVVLHWLNVHEQMQSNYASRRATPLPQYQSDHSPRRTPSPAVSHAGSMYAPSIGRAPLVPLSTATAANIHGQHALYRLFGQDLDAYVDAHADTYEQAKKKWTECTVEEWRAGADGMTLPFYTVLELRPILLVFLPIQ